MSAYAKTGCLGQKCHGQVVKNDVDGVLEVQNSHDDTSQMATLIFEDMIRGHHLNAQDLVTPRAQEYARKTPFEHKQGRVWKIAWSIEDLKTHGFGQYLMGHDLVISIKGAITMEPAAASAILAKLKAITRQWEVINERLDHMGVPREQVGYLDTRQDEDRSSCELRGKNVIPYTHMNVVAVLPSLGVHESSFCDTLDIVRSHEDQTLVVGTQALVDPLDDEIDSHRENDLCPSSASENDLCPSCASTYNLTKVPLPSDESIHTLLDPCEKKGESMLVCELPTTSEGEQNDQSGVDDLDLLEYLENPSCDCLCEDDFDCGPLASRVICTYMRKTLVKEKLFDAMPCRNLVRWNVMMTGYLNSNNPGKCLKLFREMAQRGLNGNDTTIVLAVSACARCGRAEIARLIFDRISIKNIVCWNAMILGYCIHGNRKDGLNLYSNLLSSRLESTGKSHVDNLVLPDEITFVSVLCACAREGLVTEERKYFGNMSNAFGIKPSFAHYWCLANILENVGLMQEAIETLKNMPVDSDLPLESSLWSELLGSARLGQDVSLGEQIANKLIDHDPENFWHYLLLVNIYAAAGR
ncbi:hypothetical protein BC332_23730 [Capsicum chinense]|nr:hypothetical protein BC332_23730 [Capsicum chinense]